MLSVLNVSILRLRWYGFVFWNSEVKTSDHDFKGFEGFDCIMFVYGAMFDVSENGISSFEEELKRDVLISTWL